MGEKEKTVLQKPQAETEYTYLPNEEIMKISDKLIEDNLEAYKELAK